MPDGVHLVASGRGELLIINPDSLAITRRISNLGVGQILYSATTPDRQSVLAPAPYDSVVVVVDLNTGRPLRRIHTGLAPIRILIDSVNGVAYVANATDDHLTVIDLSDWSTRNLGDVNGPNGLALVR